MTMISQILLYDQPRSGGHLLQRTLSKQPLLHLLYNASGSSRGTQVEWLMSTNWDDGMPEATASQFERQIQETVSGWREELAKAKDESKILMVEDHSFSSAKPEIVMEMIRAASTTPTVTEPTNFTLFPNDLLLHPGTVPVLTIRDPRLTVPSAYRVLKDMNLPHGSGRPNFLISTSTLWHRMLYDFFVAHSIQPIIVDADDLMTSPAFARNLAEKLGLDAEKVCLQWEPVEKEGMHPMLWASQKYLFQSSGVDPGKAAKNLDMKREVANWDREFGEDVELIRAMVELAEPGYRWLWERRFKVEDQNEA